MVVGLKSIVDRGKIGGSPPPPIFGSKKGEFPGLIFEQTAVIGIAPLLKPPGLVGGVQQVLNTDKKSKVVSPQTP